MISNFHIKIEQIVLVVILRHSIKKASVEWKIEKLHPSELKRKFIISKSFHTWQYLSRAWSRPITSACRREIKYSSPIFRQTYPEHVWPILRTWWDIENIFVFIESPSSLCIASVDRAQRYVFDRQRAIRCRHDWDFHGSNRWIVNQKSAIGQRSSLSTSFRRSRCIFHMSALFSSCQLSLIENNIIHTLILTFIQQF